MRFFVHVHLYCLSSIIHVYTNIHTYTSMHGQICERFNGEVPNTFEDLESLPGVGHKTASVVMTQVRT